MKKIAAGFVGLLVAPLIGAVLMGVVGLKGGLDFDWLLKSLPVYYVFSFFATIVFGAPIFVVLLRFNFISWWSTLAAGVAVGFLVATVIKFPSLAQANDVAVMGLIGATSSFGFWLIWRRGS